MARVHLVAQREGRWWITIGGQRSGPFASVLVAEASAIASAKQAFKAHQAARVAVESDGLHVVYDSADPGRTRDPL